MNPIACYVRTRFKSWLSKRIPSSNEITLTQRSIFIFPTATGFAFIALLLLLLFGAINYQNSLIFLVTFLLGSLFTVTILHTYKNLAQINLKYVRSTNGFCGDAVEFFIHISRPEDSPREDIEIGWPESQEQNFDLLNCQELEIPLTTIGKRRGYFSPGRFRVSTTYPLGLLRAWTWIDLSFVTLVYPKPIEQPLPTIQQSNSVNQEENLIVGTGEDFHSLRPYQHGDSVKHISWRHYARSEQLHLQQHAMPASNLLILDWQQIEGDMETRLSILTGWAQQLNQSGSSFGLRLPNHEIQPNHGSTHYQNVLTSLALYPQPTQ